MADRDIRERDILVASNEFAYVQDLTKGDIVLYVGPTKISLSNTERLVVFQGGRFVPIRGDEGNVGVNPFVLASSAQYILVENPPKDPGVKSVKGSNSSTELLIGRRVVVPGPATFPLWPGQRAKVIDGHELRENQYLITRVYDHVEGDPSPIGTEKVVRGSEVSFYIPKTGLEVVPDGGHYVRNAVTLADGEYCILRTPDGQRRYRRGPDVVFPEPMETFVEADGARIFKARQLRRSMGLHVRVVREFSAAAGDQVPAGAYVAGQEIFIKDREGFFFPTEHLEVIGEVHAVPISDKEGIYVRDIETGRIWTEVGPKSFLPDPTKVEIAYRSLDAETAKLYGVKHHDSEKAVTIYIPPSFAVLVTAKDKREVVRGPRTRILDFDEDLEVLKLSTGTPKTDEHLLSTCFLLTEGNKVSDMVRVRTGDHVELNIRLSYRVTFTAAPGGGAGNERWFNVKNYVALMCDHLASIVRAAVRGTSIESFHSGGAEVVRKAILGEKHGEEKRAGRRFEENGMWIYDVEVLDLKILDAEVEKLLADAQKAAISSEVGKKQEELRLAAEKQKESVNQQIYQAQMATLAKSVELEASRRALAEAKVRAVAELDKLERVGKAKNEAEALEISSTARAAAGSREAELQARMLEARVGAFKEQMGALQPDLVVALKAAGDRQLAGELTKNLSPLAILGGTSVAEVAERLMRALPVGLHVEMETKALAPKAPDAKA